MLDLGDDFKVTNQMCLWTDVDSVLTPLPARDWPGRTLVGMKEVSITIVKTDIFF